MKDYFFLHTSWFNRCKGYPTIVRQLIETNRKRQMTTKEEGLLFVRLMKKTLNKRRKS